MKIKIGEEIYDSKQCPIMVILNAGEKKQISDMHPDATKYCQYPGTEEWVSNDYEKIIDWMKIDGDTK